MIDKKKGGLENVKSIKGEFRKSVVQEKAKPHRNYSEKEMIEKIDRYAHFAKSNGHRKVMRDIKQKHYGDKQHREQKRGIQVKHGMDGIKAGLHDRFAMDNVKANFAKKDQQERSFAVAQAKLYYHQNYSLSKTYKENLERQMSKTRDKAPEKTILLDLDRKG